jgi:hypothetical protein
MLISPETWLPERPIMPAGLLAIMLGSSVEAAAPAKAFPSAEALFSRSWKPDPQASPANAIPAVGDTREDVPEAITIQTDPLPQFWKVWSSDLRQECCFSAYYRGYRENPARMSASQPLSPRHSARAMAGLGQLLPHVSRRLVDRSAPEAAINEEPSECVSLPYSDELTPNAPGEPRPRAGARHERRRLGVGFSACFGVQGGNRVQRAALLPSGCFSLYASILGDLGQRDEPLGSQSNGYSEVIAIINR